MNFDLFQFMTTPSGSLASIQEDSERTLYVQRIHKLPNSVLVLLRGPKTGAFIRGLGKEYKLSEAAIVQLAFLVLRVALGEVKLSALSEVLQNRFTLLPARAKSLAESIERDIFSPYMIELNAYLAQKPDHSTQENKLPVRPTPSANKPSSQPSNVLDLKKDWRGPTPPPFKK